METQPKFDVEVDLSSGDGNAIVIIGKVMKAIRRAGASPAQVEEFKTDATSGDYDHVLQTAMKWVDVV